MNLLSKIFYFYRDGFAGMTIGRSLWILILVKVAVIFLVLKLFFFPNIIKTESQQNNMEPANFVRSEILQRTSK